VDPSGYGPSATRQVLQLGITAVGMAFGPMGMAAASGFNTMISIAAGDHVGAGIHMATAVMGAAAGVTSWARPAGSMVPVVTNTGRVYSPLRTTPVAPSPPPAMPTLGGGGGSSGRALRLPSINGSLAGTNTMGETLPNGQVWLRPGLSRVEQAATLRHESVHAYLSVPDGAPMAAFRQKVGMWGYNNSHLLRFTEEALAEGYASRSIIQGIMHPLQNGYGISIPRLMLEAGAVGAGIGGSAYLGYRLGGGGQ
jgi:hypothetical protein